METSSNDTLIINSHHLLTTDVTVVVGDMGLSLRGGGPYWKTNTIVAGGKRYRTKHSTTESAIKEFCQIKERCQQTLFIDPTNQIILPRIPEGFRGDPLEVMTRALASARHEFTRRIIGQSLICAFLFGLGIALTIIFFNLSSHPDGLFLRMMAGAIVMFIGVATKSHKLWMTIQTSCKLKRLLEKIGSNQEIDVQLLTSLITPNQSQPVSFIGGTLAILSVLFGCLPFVGVVLGAISIIINFRQGRWPKKLSIIGFSLGCVMLIIAFFSMSRAH